MAFTDNFQRGGEGVKHAVDIAMTLGGGTTITMFSWSWISPALAALLVFVQIVFWVLRIMETKVVQKWLHRFKKQ